MDKNITQDGFTEVFKTNLKIEAKTVSIDTLLSDRYIKKIESSPYYQRNYVWQKDKQSFFIESVILGTEIPPIVLYKSGMKAEIIDGKQRFETLKRFKSDEFPLYGPSLLELQALSKKTFSKLNTDIQKLFKNTKIRIFEFEVVGIPNLDPIVEDKIKKEIFRRYNTGITPLNQTEIDNAKYDSDELSDHLKELLKNDSQQFELIKKFLFKNNDKTTIVDMVTFFRKILILHQIPISRYADTSEKSFIIDLMYDNYFDNLKDSINSEHELWDDEDSDALIEKSINKSISTISQEILASVNLLINTLNSDNIFIYECLLWAISVIKNEGIEFDIRKNTLAIKEYYSNDQNKQKYNTDNDHYYGNIISRFSNTADLFNNLTGVNFKKYIRSSEFKEKLRALRQTERDAELTMERLNDLRINKPSPSSKPICQIIQDLASNQYMVRPPYQRQEKIDVRKASAIIESIILKIKLPPIFIYVNEAGIREVVDGQQRLLSILGFLGKPYIDENGDEKYSINHGFKLKDLRILKKLNGKGFADIIREYEDQILDFDIDEIEISHELNKGFEPTDLFIRLNSKPYPIKANSFEMWNSIVDREVIEKIKRVTQKHLEWFYITAPLHTSDGSRSDRMQNEELITILSYLCYNYSNTGDVNKVLGFYPRLEKFTCRLKNKTKLTEILENFEFKPTEKENFIRCIEKTDNIITFIQNVLLDGNATKDSFNAILNIKDIKRFSRSNQELYIVWLLLNSFPLGISSNVKDQVLQDIYTMLSMLKNTDDKIVDAAYVTSFLNSLTDITTRYATLK